MNDNEKKQFTLELKPEIARGNYTNLAVITHSSSEFVVDFATMLPGLPKPEITSRMVMTPESAKRLMGALVENVSKYEAQFGQINTDDQPKGNTLNLADFGPLPGGTKS